MNDDVWPEGSTEPFRVVPPSIADNVKESLVDYYPGRWAEMVSPGPGCICGLYVEDIESNATFSAYGRPDFWCHRHQIPITRRKSS